MELALALVLGIPSLMATMVFLRNRGFGKVAEILGGQAAYWAVAAAAFMLL